MIGITAYGYRSRELWEYVVVLSDLHFHDPIKIHSTSPHIHLSEARYNSQDILPSHLQIMLQRNKEKKLAKKSSVSSETCQRMSQIDMSKLLPI
jgi:hypothetical protein